MRTLLWFTVGFSAACAVGAYLVFGSGLLLMAGVLLPGAILLFLRKENISRLLAVVALGAIVGSCWSYIHQQLYLKSAKALDQQTLPLTVTAADYSRQTDYGTAVDGTVSHDGKTYQIRAYLYDTQELSPGDRLSSEFYIRYTARGTGQDPTYHQGEGIFLLAYADEDYILTTGTESAAVNFPQRLRRQITALLDSLFPEDTAAFARALLLGDSSLMSYQMNTAFSVSGIRHVIAVSGLHVSILFSLIYLLCVRQRHLTAIIGIPLLFLFAAVAGFTPSIVRACIMQSLMILSSVFSKEYDPPTSLAFAVLVLLAINPIAITSVSFQLSVSCMIGIFAFSGRIHTYLITGKWMKDKRSDGFLARLLRGGAISIAVSFSTWIITTPLCAIHFGMISIVGILTNLVTIWMISFIFWGIIAACAIGALWLPVGMLIAWATAWPMRLVQLIATALSNLPFAAVYTTDRNVVLWLIFCYVLLAVFVLIKFRYPALLISCMLSGLFLCQIATLFTEATVQSRVSILDVGQGQCILLTTQGRYYMVDCGGSNSYEAADTAAAYLLSRGIYRLDGLILTHYDDDHAGAAPMLLSRVGAKQLYLPDIDPDSRLRKELEENNPGKIQWVEGICKIPAGDLTLVGGRQENSDNESGICVLFQPNNYDILITGDRGAQGEQALMETISLPKLELLIAGHHGSAGATSAALLQKTMPAAVVISVGNNSYGHPAQALLERLEWFGCQVLRTDLEGTIEFKG